MMGFLSKWSKGPPITQCLFRFGIDVFVGLVLCQGVSGDPLSIRRLLEELGE